MILFFWTCHWVLLKVIVYPLYLLFCSLDLQIWPWRLVILSIYNRCCDCLNWLFCPFGLAFASNLTLCFVHLYSLFVHLEIFFCLYGLLIRCCCLSVVSYFVCYLSFYSINLNFCTKTAFLDYKSNVMNLKTTCAILQHYLLVGSSITHNQTITSSFHSFKSLALDNENTKTVWIPLY